MNGHERQHYDVVNVNVTTVALDRFCSDSDALQDKGEQAMRARCNV